ncbi:MAG: hypothetical protein FWG05_04740, partial [Kiritimatiellaeota bacterium]|nr:hypothetical protein [Kiritimatiellota bacterium]
MKIKTKIQLTVLLPVLLFFNYTLLFGLPSFDSGGGGGSKDGGDGDKTVVATVNMASEGEPFTKWYDVAKHGGGHKTFTWDGV